MMSKVAIAKIKESLGRWKPNRFLIVKRNFKVLEIDGSPPLSGSSECVNTN